MNCQFSQSLKVCELLSTKQCIVTFLIIAPYKYSYLLTYLNVSPQRDKFGIAFTSDRLCV